MLFGFKHISQLTALNGLAIVRFSCTFNFLTFSYFPRKKCAWALLG
jgi:hypothetical protein